MKNETGCSNEECDNPLCSCENLEAGIICDCSDTGGMDDLCPCCVGTPE